MTFVFSCATAKGKAGAPDDRPGDALASGAGPREATKPEATVTAKDLAPSPGTRGADSGDAAILFAEEAASAKPKASTEDAKKSDKAAATDKEASRGSPSTSTAGAVAGEKAGPSASARAAPAESGLKAGFSDDNEQFNYFIKFLDQYGSAVDQYPLRIGERILLKVLDSKGRPVANADVAVTAGGKPVTAGKTYASGIFSLYPKEYPDASSYKAEVSYNGSRTTVPIDREGPRSVTVALQGERKLPAAIPIDLLFVLDTTGSMGEEIERLRDTLEIINANVGAVAPKPLVRFGLVLYRDKEDAYVTRVSPFTSDLEAFQKQLDWVEADGGGDTPEDLQSALSDAMKKMDWNADGIRLAFVITDAPPHLDYGQSYTYAEAAKDAKARAIKIHTVGSGGLPLQGEYALRQISQFTQGRYIFLTYGEKGESAGGAEASVSHHTGTNFQTDKLEAIIIRFAREELALQSDAPIVAPDDYFDAKKTAGEDRGETLQKLFAQALRNLADYSTISVGDKTQAAIAPIGFAEADKAVLAKQAEYFSESMLLSAASAKVFTIVERKDLQKILEEQEFQYSALADEKTAAKLGSLLGAQVIVTGQLFAKADTYEVFLKLLRVETGEVLSVTKAKLDKGLGL
jgi:Mg-chelatase subunit ChlD